MEKALASRDPSRGWAAADFTQSTVLVALVDGIALAVAIGVWNGRGQRAVCVIYSVAAWLLLIAGGGHRWRFLPNLSTEFGRLLGQLSMPVLVIAVAAPSSREFVVSRLPVAVVFVVLGRAAVYAIRRAGRRCLREPTAIVGAGEVGRAVADTLLGHPEYGLDPIGFVDGGYPDIDLPLPLVGDLDGLDELIDRYRFRRIIVAFGAHRESEIVKVLRATDYTDATVYAVPRLFELGVAPHRYDTIQLWGIPLQPIHRPGLSRTGAVLKRAVDVTAATAGLVLTSPVFALATLAVRVSSRGPVLFRQGRVGQRGQPIELLKFRTMTLNHDSDVTWSVDNDQRVTRVGHILRTTGIDELPQLINILRGDMSLVGPRPERPHFAKRFNALIPSYRERLRMPMGLTGWAQVHGLRGDTSVAERTRFDNYYIEHWTPWLDLVIMVRTVTTLIRAVSAAWAGASSEPDPDPGARLLGPALLPSNPSPVAANIQSGSPAARSRTGLPLDG